MSTTIDDIWDAPAEVVTRDPLFLHDSDEEMPDAPNPLQADAPNREADETAKIFDAVDDVQDGETYGRNSSPVRADKLDDDNEKGKGKDGEKKKRKPLPKLDEGRLVGDNGIPQLIMDTKYFKTKGKGHEARRVFTRCFRTLIALYQFWTHKLYPKTTFKETVDRVEKLCHSRRMQNMLSTWRDEAHGKPPEDDDDEGDKPDDGDGPATSAAPSSDAPTGADDAFFSQNHHREASAAPSNASAHQRTRSEPDMDAEMDDDAISNLHDIPSEVHNISSGAPSLHENTDDEEFWDQVPDLSDMDATAEPSLEEDIPYEQPHPPEEDFFDDDPMSEGWQQAAPPPEEWED
ncbi:Chromosome segregation in meiosis protein [Mycena kentingensis (nom. inval.)]|nr:Chromosome segregation in meiosis protein [Mycena kentingensis (nom. inval.)]